MTFGRKPITIVEIDVDFCALTYGTAPCTAALSAATPRKCFNTFKTCQDQANFDQGTLTLRFAENISGLPKTGTVFPALQSVSTRSGFLNLAASDPKSGPMGKRERIEVVLGDFVYHDNLTDKYRDQRISGAAQFDAQGYDPSRGTFFAKMLARSPYYIGRSLRVLRGYVGQTFAQMATSHYVISDWKGPTSAGVVQITAKDVLNLIDGKRVKAPAPSSGTLAADIGAGDSAARLDPPGIGNSDYPAAGRISIGREIMTFTRSGDDLTLTARAVDGSEAASHKAGDVVQRALRYENQRMSDILHDLLTNEGPVDPAFVSLATWNAADDDWMAGQLFTRTIPRPVAIDRLVGELIQHGAQLWWEPDTQLIEFLPNRPVAPGETLRTLTDEASLISGTLEFTRADDQRLTTVEFNHGVIDYSDSVTETRNYARLAISHDPAAASALEYGEDRLATIHSPWLGQTGNDAAAGVIANRLQGRFRDTPVALTGLLDAKDADLRLGDIVDVQSALLPDQTGEVPTIRMQIAMRERVGDRIRIRAESGVPTGRFGFLMIDPQVDYDSATDQEKDEGCFMIDEAVAAFPDGTGPYLIF